MAKKSIKVRNLMKNGYKISNKDIASRIFKDEDFITCEIHATEFDPKKLDL